ncbi:MAG: hypothetical protein ACTSQE_12550 [Candidatus Heimdallarchaeaceae archaeon]
MYVSNNPTTTSGWLVINPGHATQREIVEFDGIGTDGSGDYVTLVARGVGGTTEQSHEVSEPVRMNITAEMWAAIEASASTGIPLTYLDTDGTLAANSDTKLATQKATKTYVDAEISTLDSEKVGTTGNESIDGVKTFTESPIIPAPTTDSQAATKKYADDLAIAGAPDASETTKGLVEIATDAQISAGTDIGETGAALVVVPSKIPQPIWGATKEYDENDMVWHDRATWASDSDNNINYEPGGTDVFDKPFDVDSMIKSSGTAIAGDYGDFANSGLYYFYMIVGSTTLYRKTLSTAYDLSSETASDTYTLTTSCLATRGGIRVSPDGTKVFLLRDGGSYDVLYQYSTATPFDFTTVVYDGTGYVANNDTITWNFDFNGDGTKVYLVNYNADIIYERDTTSAWNVVGMSNILGTNVFYINGMTPTRFRFVDDGNKMIIVGATITIGGFGARIYDLGTAYDLTTSGSYVEIPVNNNYNYPLLSDDGLFYYHMKGAGGYNYYQFAESYWTKTGMPTGSIVSIANDSAITSYVVAYDGFMSCDFSGSVAHTTASINGINIARSIDTSPYPRGSFALPVKIGDVISFTSSVSAYMVIRLN